MEKISELIEYSKTNKRKAICFITGVPGAGKTLAGLNIATSRTIPCHFVKNKLKF